MVLIVSIFTSLIITQWCYIENFPNEIYSSLTKRGKYVQLFVSVLTRI